MSSPQFSHVILPVGSRSCTRFELSLTELRNLRDTYSVAPLFLKLRILVESVRHSLVLGRGSARLEASYVGQSHGKNAYDSCLPKAVSVLGRFLATYISWTDLLGALAERSRSAT